MCVAYLTFANAPWPSVCLRSPPPAHPLSTPCPSTGGTWREGGDALLLSGVGNVTHRFPLIPMRMAAYTKPRRRSPTRSRFSLSVPHGVLQLCSYAIPLALCPTGRESGRTLPPSYQPGSGHGGDAHETRH
eukprot:scaffold1297_cov368-Prasinococcus_capsulatus_cf.AAC.10